VLSINVKYTLLKSTKIPVYFLAGLNLGSTIYKENIDVVMPNNQGTYTIFGEGIPLTAKLNLGYTAGIGQCYKISQGKEVYIQVDYHYFPNIKLGRNKETLGLFEFHVGFSAPFHKKEEKAKKTKKERYEILDDEE